MALRNVIVIGAGGNLGPYILSALTTDPHFTVSILTRNSSRSTFPPHLSVHRVGDNYPEADLLQAFKGQHVVVSVVALAAVPQQKMFIDAAVRAGVKRFIPSEFGTDSRNNLAHDLLPQLTKANADIATYLQSKERDGLEWSVFINGPFLDLALVNFLGYDLGKHQATIVNDGSHRWSGTPRPMVGRAVKNALLIPERTANQYLFIGAVTASQNEFQSAFEKVTDKKWDVIHVDAEKEKQAALCALSKGDFSAFPTLVRYIICVKGYGGNYLDYEPSANEMLGLPHTSVDEIVAGLLKVV